MKVILKDLEPQSKDDLSFITSEHAVMYVKELEEKSGNEAMKLQTRLEMIRT